MKNYTVNVLLVEDEESNAKLIRLALAEGDNSVFRVQWVKRISVALQCLLRCQNIPAKRFDVILLDLTLPDAEGPEAFIPLFEAAPEALILVLSNSANEDTARVLVKKGAYDYLGKQFVNCHWLPRALRYVAERKQAENVLLDSEAALFDANERAQITLNSIGDAVVATDMMGVVTYMNLMAETMTGWHQDEAIGRPLAEVFCIVDGKTRKTAENPVQAAIRENQVVGLTANCVLIRRDGFESVIEDSTAPIHNHQGQVLGAVMVFHDVSASREMALKMTHLAQHDILTGKPNRLLLQERLAQAIVLAKRHHRQVGLLFLDLDYFKYINDSLGHAVGDQLLISVANRLQACARASDTVCRQGGDEFVILLTEIEQPQDAAQVASKVLAAMTRPHIIGAHELQISVSIGISVYPDDGDSVDSIMKNADTAMYHAKSNGRDNYQFFRADMNDCVMQRLLLEGSLRRALKHQEFVLHYQPQFDLKSGVMTGAEALIRWRDPELGLVYPDDFIPTAIESGLILPIGRWVLRQTCIQIGMWLEAGSQPVPVAVNVSMIELTHPLFVTGLAEILMETGLPANYLKLEFTEKVLTPDTEAFHRTLQALIDMGVGLVIDDFGTGHSSLSLLRHYAISALKIDRAFVHDMVTYPDDASIINAVIGIGHSLKQRVVAKGVENQKQLMMLRAQRCDTGQGFLFGRPQDADGFTNLLMHQNDGTSQGKQA
ncbi:putative bifunctional diguanylate cyclase/phosphodiesterase [Gynuella sunshinyii]|uniref:Putative signal transduction protein containing a membrane domain, an EAL and a GGDEF domain n=1 Tax=Gynuella sunshinyii YC6258 TaxID=1445510 RepID=A0A0C5VLM6_9GAMM|nr:EAL domain-containing protein [Gynuella sunshinyii]AJQ95622.1 putative signal transduction protein containing a membrane domain, an EAL and a GGDEF domain [Gynuella sunshinyii YC6258]